MWFMSTPCSLLQELLEHCQLHPSLETHLPHGLYVALLAGAAPKAPQGQWHGVLWVPAYSTALCRALCVCV